MTKNLGPWTTAASAGSTAHLSTFWKRRLAMLPAAHRSSNRLGGRVVLFLLVAAALLWALPTLRESSVATTQAAGERSPATTAPTAKAASLTAKPPTLKNDSGAVASSEARATILKVNTPWLQPKTHPRSYIFSMKHTDKEDLWEAIVEFDSSAGVSVRPGPNSKERFDPYKGRLDANDFALLEGVSFYGPLHQAVRSPDAYQVRVLGDGEVSGTEARVMHLRPAKPDEGTYPESLIRQPCPFALAVVAGFGNCRMGVPRRRSRWTRYGSRKQRAGFCGKRDSCKESVASLSNTATTRRSPRGPPYLDTLSSTYSACPPMHPPSASLVLGFSI